MSDVKFYGLLMKITFVLVTETIAVFFAVKNFTVEMWAVCRSDFIYIQNFTWNLQSLFKDANYV